MLSALIRGAECLDRGRLARKTRQKTRLAARGLRLIVTENSLLRLFAQHAGKVLTHRPILREVWGPNALEQAHSLRVYTAHLRDKLEADPAQPKLILTGPGVGYRFVVAP